MEKHEFGKLGKESENYWYDIYSCIFMSGNAPFYWINFVSEKKTADQRYYSYGLIRLYGAEMELFQENRMEFSSH